MMPGMGNMKDLQVDEKALSRVEAIIQSMTPQERENPGLLGSSRKKRIAAGSGTKVEDVNQLLKRFETMQKLVRQFSGKNMRKLQRKMGKGGFAGFGGGFPGF